MTAKKSFWGIGVIVLFLATFTSLLVYLIAQQSLRLSANFIPAQMATETSILLEQGRNANEAVSTQKTDLTRSLSPFVMVYDKDSKLIVSSATMGGEQPVYPRGVLGTVAQKGESRVTWQPKSGLRYATVAIAYKDGYIVAGQSLGETEKLIDKIGQQVLAAWGACVVFTFVMLALVAVISRKKEKRIN